VPHTPPLPGRQLAAHVRNAVARTLQARMAHPAGPGAQPAAHVRAAVASVHAPAAAVQPKALPARPSPRVLQRMEERPRRSTASYDTDFRALAMGRSEATPSGKLGTFVTKAKEAIAVWKSRASVQPYRNTPKSEARSEKTAAHLCARMNGMVVGTGESGGNQHGEMRILDSVGWDRRSQGNQYYFVCDEGKECCYLCTAIAGLLGIAVAASDDTKYPEYVTPSLLQTDEELWAAFIGAEAYQIWQELGGEQAQSLRRNLGWVSALSMAY
jgi:hypothetical protein